MNIRQVAKIKGNQDGAIFAHELFRFDTKGRCAVYDLSEIARGEVEPTPTATFVLDRVPELVPHSNAVFFGREFYEEGDELPLLYSNVYNNYKNAEDPMLGTCLVYRIWRTEDGFSTALVQIIRVGFTEDARLWRASESGHGVRPYGNFVMDNERGALWGFVMRDEQSGTRFFSFDAPSVHAGELRADGVRTVVLAESDIRECFDMPYYRFIQGAILHDGKIYSTEGFQNDMLNRPAIRVVSLAKRTEVYYDLTERGMLNEAEMIDFYQGECYYSDADGNLYSVEF